MLYVFLVVICLCCVFLYYWLKNDIRFFINGVNLAAKQLLEENNTDYFETRLYFSTTPTIITSNPDFIKHIFDSANYRARFGAKDGLTLLGMYTNGLIWNYNFSKWKITRKFFHQSLNNELFTNSFDNIVQNIKNTINIKNRFCLSNNNNKYDILQLLRTITMSVTKHLFFGSDIILPDTMCESIVCYFKAWEFFFLYPKYFRFVFNQNKYYTHKKSIQHLMNNCDNIINQCLKIYNDNPKNNSLKPFIKSVIQTFYLKTNDFSYNDMRQTVLEMYLAGTDTSSVSMFYTLFAVKKSANYKVYNKIKEEILSIEKKYKLSDIQFKKTFLPISKEWPYLTAILKESMRIKPVGPVIMRRALDNDMYKNKKIRKNTQIICCIERMHNDAKYFTHPFVFKPQRFLNNNDNIYYVPFGEGPKSCVGRHLAMYEMKIILYYLLKHFDFESKLQLKDIMTHWDIAQQPINIYEMTMIARK